MLERLDQIEAKYEELQARLSDGTSHFAQFAFK